MSWEQIYDLLGIKEIIYFISSPYVQDMLFPIKLIFVLFTAFFFSALIYFYINSSYLKYQFWQDVSEFFSWQAYGLREINRRWRTITKKVAVGSEKEYKLALVEADDFLRKVLEDADYQGDTLEELAEDAGKRVLPNLENILQAHKLRNTVVYDVNYRLDLNLAKKILDDYEKAVKSVSS